MRVLRKMHSLWPRRKESGPSLRPIGPTARREDPALRKHPMGCVESFSDEGTNPKLEILRSLMWDMGYEICDGTRLVASISDLNLKKGIATQTWPRPQDVVSHSGIKKVVKNEP